MILFPLFVAALLAILAVWGAHALNRKKERDRRRREQTRLLEYRKWTRAVVSVIDPVAGVRVQLTRYKVVLHPFYPLQWEGARWFEGHIGTDLWWETTEEKDPDNETPEIKVVRDRMLITHLNTVAEAHRDGRLSQAHTEEGEQAHA